jgi:anti-anti-sigma factor
VPSTAHGLVVDLSAVTYLDSTGIRLMLGLSSRARRRDQLAVAVAPLGSRVRRVMSIAGAGDAIALEATPEAALSRVESQVDAGT